MKKTSVKKTDLKKTNIRKSIQTISKYLLSLKENLQSDLNSIEKDIERVVLLISDAQKSKSNIESTFDSSYMILSSSQVAKLDEFAEIDSFDELIKDKNEELKVLENQKKIMLTKISELDKVISCTQDVEKSFT